VLSFGLAPAAARWPAASKRLDVSSFLRCCFILSANNAQQRAPSRALGLVNNPNCAKTLGRPKHALGQTPDVDFVKF
jgi:hypothetical protein